MSNRLGRQQTVGYARENPRNTAITAATHFFPHTEFTLETGEPGTRDDESAFGMPEKLLRQDIVSYRPSGTLSGHLYADGALQFMLYHFFNQVKSAQSGSTGAYLNQFRRMKNDSDTDTFTLQYTRSDIGNLRAVGCAVQAITLDFGLKEATYSADIIALREEAGDAQTVVMPEQLMPILATQKRADGTAGSFKYASSLANLAASGTDYKIRQASLKLSKDTDWDAGFGGEGYAHDTFNKGVDFELSFSGVVKSNIWHAGNLAGTRRALELDFNNPQLVLGTSVLNPRFRLQLPPTLVKVSHSADLDDLVMFDATARGSFSATDNRTIDILIQNLTNLSTFTQDANVYA